MKILYLGIPFLLNLLLMGCSSRDAILMEEYKGHKVTGKDLTIIKLFEKPSIANEDDVTDDLGPGIPNEVYTAFFNKIFLYAFQVSNCCNKLNYITDFSELEMEERTLDINSKAQMRILLPKENSKLEIDSVASDYILLIDSLYISRKKGESGTWIGETHYGGSFGGLYHQIHFAMWDNTNRKLVSYGIVHEESAVAFGMTDFNWRSVIIGLVTKIFKYSPFPVPKFIYH